jgi:subtilisin family serine protease
MAAIKSRASLAATRPAAVLAAIIAVLAGVLAVPCLPSGPAWADSVRDEQWQLDRLDARTAWTLASGAGVTVAVIDSGVDATHPDLIGQVLPGADFVDGTTDGRKDPVGHGTTVAALIAGRADDRSGVVGLAPRAKILPVRVLDRQNKYDDPAVVAKGIRWAVDHGAGVVNLSLGGQLRSDVLAGALDYAAAHDVVVVACTGNIAAGSSDREIWYPAREAGVVAVAGLSNPVADGSGPAVPAPRHAGGHGGGADGESLWSGSLTGRQTVLTAPAANLLGAKPGGYWWVQGTSFASPLVAASAALIRSRFPGLSAANVINRLISTARDLGAPGRDDRYGFGEVNPVGALRAELLSVTANPLRPAGTPGSAATGAPAGSKPADPAPGRKAAKGASASRPGGVADGSGGVGIAGRAAAVERRLGTSVAVGGAVAILLFLAGTLVLRRRTRR